MVTHLPNTFFMTGLGARGSGRQIELFWRGFLAWLFGMVFWLICVWVAEGDVESAREAVGLDVDTVRLQSLRFEIKCSCW